MRQLSLNTGSHVRSDIQIPGLLKPGLLLLIGWVIASAVYSPVTQGSNDNLEHQRELYRQAKDALALNSLKEFRSLKVKLRDYPLYPYLEYSELNNRLSRARNRDIRRFLERYQDTPLSRQLRVSWLERLAERDRWRDFLEFYTEGTHSTELDCYQARALYRNGNEEQALDSARQLWQVGKSQPEACDPIFAVMVEKNLITEEIAWQRYTKAVLNHQYQLARYLERFFTSPEYRQLARNYIAVDRNSRLIGNYDLFDVHTPEVLSVIEHGITHLARTDSSMALNHWNRYRQSHSFSASARTNILSRLVMSLYEQDHRKAADTYLLESLDEAPLNLIEWRLRRAVQAGEWQSIPVWLERLPEEARLSNRWQYWQARSLVLQAQDTETLEQVHDQVHAIYENLASERSYYGFLASEWLQSAHQMQHQPVTVDPEQIDTMANRGNFQRVRELLHHGEHLSARREWLLATRNFSDEQWIVAAQLAERWQWHNQAIMSMVQAGYWNDIDIRFPRAYASVFEKYAEENRIPLNLLFAVSRQESAFGADVSSPAGARGLMQVMPGTASMTARNNGIPYSNSSDLNVPDVNVQIGSTYYRELLDRFNNNRILATAAYNAGPHRVDRWLKETEGRLPFDAWVEAIPFRETRNYVQNVLAFSVIYAHKLGGEETMLSEQERQLPL